MLKFRISRHIGEHDRVVLRLVLREFELVAEVVDGEKFTRFFKLFPLVGRMDVGLESYECYVQPLDKSFRDALFQICHLTSPTKK